jgi:hypothetical protein
MELYFVCLILQDLENKIIAATDDDRESIINDIIENRKIFDSCEKEVIRHYGKDDDKIQRQLDYVAKIIGAA